MTSAPVPAPTRDEVFDEPVDEAPNTEIERDFYEAYLRDLHGFDPEILAEKPDRWLWSRAKEVRRDE